LLTLFLLLSVVSLYGAVCTFHDAATLAAAAFQKACNLVEVDPSTYTAKYNTSRAWYDAFDVDPEEVDEAMPDIDDHLAYHNENLSRQIPSNSSKAHGSTPNVHQHTSLLGQREPEGLAPVSSEVQPKQLHFASQETVIEAKEDASNVLPPTTNNEGEETNGNGEKDSWAVQREERTDPSRPISRHGSKGANRGPPPPLALEDAGVAAVDSPSDPHEKAAAAKVHREQIQQEESAVTSEEEGAL